MINDQYKVQCDDSMTQSMAMALAMTYNQGSAN